MPKFQVHIYQGYRVERSICIEVEAEDLESAIEEQAATEAPSFDDPRWLTGWDLQTEDVSAASPTEHERINHAERTTTPILCWL
jgi:hypothetical protein